MEFHRYRYACKQFDSIWRHKINVKTTKLYRAFDICQTCPVSRIACIAWASCKPYNMCADRVAHNIQSRGNFYKPTDRLHTVLQTVPAASGIPTKRANRPTNRARRLRNSYKPYKPSYKPCTPPREFLQTVQTVLQTVHAA